MTYRVLKLLYGPDKKGVCDLSFALFTYFFRNGSSIEAVTAEYHKALDAVESAQRDINDMNIFIRVRSFFVLPFRLTIYLGIKESIGFKNSKVAAVQKTHSDEGKVPIHVSSVVTWLLWNYPFQSW